MGYNVSAFARVVQVNDGQVVEGGSRIVGAGVPCLTYSDCAFFCDACLFTDVQALNTELFLVARSCYMGEFPIIWSNRESLRNGLQRKFAVCQLSLCIACTVLFYSCAPHRHPNHPLISQWFYTFWDCAPIRRRNLHGRHQKRQLRFRTLSTVVVIARDKSDEHGRGSLLCLGSAHNEHSLFTGGQ